MTKLEEVDIRKQCIEFAITTKRTDDTHIEIVEAANAYYDFLMADKKQEPPKNGLIPGMPYQ